MGICVINRAGAGEGKKQSERRVRCHRSAVHSNARDTGARFTPVNRRRQRDSQRSVSLVRCSPQRSWLERGSQQCVVLNRVDTCARGQYRAPTVSCFVIIKMREMCTCVFFTALPLFLPTDILQHILECTPLFCMAFYLLPPVRFPPSYGTGVPVNQTT